MSLHFIRLSIAIAALLAIAPAGALAAEHVVKMLNDNGKGEYMVFEPSYIEAAPGDTVKFVAVDQFHMPRRCPRFGPKARRHFRANSPKTSALTIEELGVYGIKCQPHYPMGMIALVVAGEPVNKDQLGSYEPPAMAKERFEALAAKLPQ